MIWIKARQLRNAIIIIILELFVVVHMTRRKFRMIGAALVAAVLQSANNSEASEKQNFSSDVLFQSACAPCHGQRGAGDGPVASVIKGGVPRIDDLTKRHYGKFPADYVRETIDGRLELAAHGTPNMPVWGLRFKLLHNAGDLTGKKADASGEAAADMLVDALTKYVASLQAQ